LLIGAVLLSAGVSGGVTWMVSQQALAEMKALAKATDGESDAHAAEPEKPKGPSLYVPLDPAFVVNLADPSGLRFLLLLLGQQKIVDLGERAGKENLQAAVLDEIQKVLKEEAGAPGVEAVYFTSFVMQ
jgi:flagellar FliL protein